MNGLVIVDQRCPFVAVTQENNRSVYEGPWTIWTAESSRFVCDEDADLYARNLEEEMQTHTDKFNEVVEEVTYNASFCQIDLTGTLRINAGRTGARTDCLADLQPKLLFDKMLH